MTNNTPNYEDNLYFDSQNTKNEQQKDLCITSEQLTEQWKKHKLVGWYFTKVDPCACGIFEITPVYFEGICYSWEKEAIIEVLAPVPSYDEWKNFVDANISLFDTVKMLEKDNFRLEKQNAELKDTIEALKSELKEVCDVLIRKCPEMKEWVMLNWKNLYEVKNGKYR